MTELYMGKRGDRFKAFIETLLERGNIKDKYIQDLLDENAMNVYNKVFTHPSVNSEENYEFYEFIGDLTLNKAIGQYLSNSYPELRNANGVKILTRLKIILVQKDTIQRIAKDAGFWPYVSASIEDRERKMRPILEDVFESFLGATEMLLDNKYSVGVGYSICYDIIKSFYKEQEISFSYEYLYDDITRLKELVDYMKVRINRGDQEYKDKLSKIIKPDLYTTFIGYKLTNAVEFEPESILKKSEARLEFKNKTNKRFYIALAQGVKPKGDDAKQVAAKNMLRILNQLGLNRPVPDIYKKLQQKYG